MILRPPTSTHRHPLALLDALPIFKNILLPTSYITGQEVIPFAAAMAPQVKNINMLTAMRTGEIHPTMLARHISTLDHIRSEEHTSELQSLMRISYAVFCLKKKKK